MQRLKNVFSYKEMIFSMVRRELRGRYKGSVLGFLWTLINPLFQLIIYTIVFSYIMRAGKDDYYLFLFVALVPWIFFSSSVQVGAGCIWSQKGMINKIFFPREVLPISTVISQLVNMLLSLVVVFAVLIIARKPLSIKALLVLPVIILVETILALGIVFLVSAISVFFQDLMQILGILMMLWQFLTPVMYEVQDIPEHMRVYFGLNPMTPIVEAYRDVLYYGKVPQLSNMMSGLILGLALLLIGWIVFGCLEKKFSEVL